MKREKGMTRIATTVVLALATVLAVTGESQGRPTRVSRSVARSSVRSMRRRPAPIQVQRRSLARHFGRLAPRPAPRPIAVPAPRRSTSVSVNFGFVSAAPAYPVVAPVPVVVPAPVVVPPPPIVTMPPPAVYQAPMPAAAPSGVVFQGVLSDDDDIAPESVCVGDGIEVEIEKTRDEPPRADLEIQIGDFEETYKRLVIGSRISFHGLSGQLYHLDVVDVNDELEAVTIVISR